MAAVLLGLAALGFFLFTREVLGAPRWAALATMGLVGVDRMVLHTRICDLKGRADPTAPRGLEPEGNGYRVCMVG